MVIVGRVLEMPIYEYKCDSCGEIFELIQKFSDTPLKVHENCGGAVERLLSAAALQFKGSGWYVTDYAGKSNGKEKPAKEGKEAKEAKEAKKDGYRDGWYQGQLDVERRLLKFLPEITTGLKAIDEQVITETEEVKNG